MFSTEIRWVKIAESRSELADKTSFKKSVVLRVNGKSLLLVNDNDHFYLFKNKCPHQGISLENAQCAEGFLVCPWHRYGFDLKTGRGGGLHLENYPIEFRENGVYAGFEYFSLF